MSVSSGCVRPICSSSIVSSVHWCVRRQRTTNTEDFMNLIIKLAANLRLLDDNVMDVEVVQKIL